MAIINQKLRTRQFLSQVITCSLALLISLDSCTDKATNPVPSSTGTASGQSIDGVLFTPTTTKVTDTGNGLEIRLKDSNNDVSLRLSDKITGTYNIINTVRNGRIDATSTAVVLIIVKGEPYYGVGGSVTVTVGTDGKVSGTFSVDGQGSGGKTSSLRDGKITSQTVTTPTTTQCLVSKIQVSGTDGYARTENFAYDADGKLVQRVYNVTSSGISYTYNYFWINGHVAWMHQLRNTNNTGQSVSTYSGNQLNKLVDKYNSTTGAAYTYDYTFTYDGSKLTKIVSLLSNTLTTTTSTYTDQYVFTGSNVTSHTFSDGTSATPTSATYSLYDTKNNPYSLIAASLNTTGLFPNYTGSTISISNGYLQSVNNIGKEVGSNYTATYTYTSYNTQGYPNEIKETDVYTAGGTTTYTTTFTYTGCK